MTHDRGEGHLDVAYRRVDLALALRAAGTCPAPRASPRTLGEGHDDVVEQKRFHADLRT